jgi:tRNA pseudouridine38/39 synthase
VVGLTVRSQQPPTALAGGTAGELAYARILNRLLPPDIRVLAWAPVDAAFNARFGCLQRTYKYFFDRGHRDLAVRPIHIHSHTHTCVRIRTHAQTVLRDGAMGEWVQWGWDGAQRMQEAAAAFVGVHDYRNFCRPDRAQGATQNFMRHIYRFTITPVGPPPYVLVSPPL